MPKKSMKKTETIATGKPCVVNLDLNQLKNILKGAHEYAKRKWTRLEIIFACESRHDGNRVRDVQGRYGNCKNSVNGLRAREHEQSNNKRKERIEYDCVDRGASEVGHSVQPVRKWQCAISREGIRLDDVQGGILIKKC